MKSQVDIRNMVAYNFLKLFVVMAFVFALILANRWVSIGVLLGVIAIFRSINGVMNGYLIDYCRKNEKYFIVVYMGTFVIHKIIRWFLFSETIVLLNDFILLFVPFMVFIGLHRVVLKVMFRKIKVK